MKIILLNTDEEPVHEFEMTNDPHKNVSEDCIVCWEPDDTHYAYFDSDGHEWISFKLQPVVCVNPVMGAR